jgi:hypothetical protein
VRSVLSSGSGLEEMVALPMGVTCAIADPTQTGKFIYASDAGSTGSFTVYRSSSLSGGTALVSRTFEDVSMIQATSDGSVFLLAVSSGVRGLYAVRGGVATLVDQAESAEVRSDGSQAVYVKLSGDATAISVWTASSGAKRTLVSGGFNHMPALSRDGTQVVYSALDLDRGDFDLYTIPTAGGAIRRLTNTAGRSEYGASFDDTGTRISYATTATSDAPGIYVYASGVSAQIVSDSNVTSGTYWASSTGRSLAPGGMTRFSRLTQLPR